MMMMINDDANDGDNDCDDGDDNDDSDDGDDDSDDGEKVEVVEQGDEEDDVSFSSALCYWEGFSPQVTLVGIMLHPFIPLPLCLSAE